MACLEIGTPRRWHPVGQPLLGDSLTFLLTSVANKELLRAPKAPGAVHIYAQCSYGTQQCKGWICLLRGQCLQVHQLIAEGRGGNLGHVSRPGSQDNVRVGRPEHKALFAHRKCLEVPDPLDIEVSAVRSAVLATGISALLSPVAQRDPSEVQPGQAPIRNLTMRSCFPRDRPSTASGWAAIAATYTSKVEGDSLCSNLSCRKKALLQSCTFVGFLGEKNTSSRTDSTSMHRLALLKELYSE